MDKIVLTGPKTDDWDTLKRVVEEEIASFERLFTAEGQGGLVTPEKALIRTYILAKISGRLS